MASRRSPARDDSYEDDYSDDFDDDATEGEGRRYKTRSPVLRSDKRDSTVSDAGPSGAGRLGAKTFRKSKGLATPPSFNSLQESEEEDFRTPRSRFTADEVAVNPKPGKGSSLRAASQYTYNSYSPRKNQTFTYEKRNRYRSYRGRGRGKGGRMTGRMSTESKTDNITKRVLSARRLRINELQNSHHEAQQVIRDLKDEIKLLKKTQNRQDKALQRFEDRESDLPQLIQRQNNEVRSLRDQIRKWREKYEKTDRYLRDAEDDLEKVKTKLKKLKSLADEKDLPERGELNKKLNNQELDLEAKDVKIRELERYIQNLEKNHRHELGIERARQKDVKKQIEQLREENQKLNSTVEEKTKEIQMKNIYANRMVKPPHRLPNSYNGTPHGTPPPRRRRPSLSGADGITPRDRAKQMEEKRREEMRKQRELKQRNKRHGSYLSDKSPPRRQHQTFLTVTDDEAPPPTHHKPVIRTSRNLSAHSNVEQHEKMKRDEELRKKREQEEWERAERERQNTERERYEQERELKEKERELNEQARRDLEERKLREERDKMKRDADDRARTERERREREERDRREKKEREERDRKERREREERERRERERLEQERRAQEERRRFEDDGTIQAEKKKKDEILQKLREIDEGKNRDKDKARANDPFFITDTKEDSQDSMASSKKSYTFSKPTENLHKGKPSHNEGVNSSGLGSPSKTSNRRNRDIDSIETGGYNPTFGGKTGGSGGKGLSLFDDDEPKPSKSNPNKKSNLMAELFGSSEPPKSKQNDIFASSKPKKSETSTRPSFLWDDDSSAGRKNLTTKRENSATLFGGGSALVNDEDLHKSQQRSNAAFSRRQKQTTAFHTRPTVNAVDHFDDDIEEVIL